ncbi:MAG: hypothetical protein AAGA56_23955 [Myxococcota bacterium]
MKRLILLLAFCLVASPALADSKTSWAEQRVTNGLVRPLQAKERSGSRFSRRAPTPRERRVRILDTQADKQGREFASYVIESRFGKRWRQSYTGCVYREAGSIFVAIGKQYRPAAFVLGKRVKAVPGACRVGGGQA